MKYFIIGLFFMSLVGIYGNWFYKMGEFLHLKEIGKGYVNSEDEFIKGKAIYILKKDGERKSAYFKYCGVLEGKYVLSFSKDSLLVPDAITKTFRAPRYEIPGEIITIPEFPNFIDTIKNKFELKNIFTDSIKLIAIKEIQKWIDQSQLLIFVQSENYVDRFAWLPLFDRIIIKVSLVPVFTLLFILCLCLFILLLNYFLQKKKRDKRLKHLLCIFLLIIPFSQLYSNPLIYEFNYIFTSGFLLFTLLLSYAIFHLIRNKIEKLNFWYKEILKFGMIYFSAVLVSMILLYVMDIIYYDICKLNTSSNDVQYRSPIAWYSTNVIGKFVFLFATSNLLANLFKYYFNLYKVFSKNKLDALESEKNQMELASLQSRINPHFLYNSLNSIASLASIDAPKTERMANLLADFYKINTNRNENMLIPLIEEMKRVEAYIEIEKVRFGDKLIFQKVIDEDCLEMFIPILIIQPLIENAIKYGYNKNNKCIQVKLEISQNDESLFIKIFDSGPPFNIDFYSGFGIKSVSRKLDLLYGEYGGLHFINGEEKHVVISINLNKLNKEKI